MVDDFVVESADHKVIRVRHLSSAATFSFVIESRSLGGAVGSMEKVPFDFTLRNQARLFAKVEGRRPHRLGLR